MLTFVLNWAVISQSDLNIIESHLVRSLSKDKTATRFYIMQCVRAAKARWIPIKDVFDRFGSSQCRLFYIYVLVR